MRDFDGYAGHSHNADWRRLHRFASSRCPRLRRYRDDACRSLNPLGLQEFEFGQRHQRSGFPRGFWGSLGG